jgi:regulator of nucleoside diphosphate kinase
MSDRCIKTSKADWHRPTACKQSVSPTSAYQAETCTPLWKKRLVHPNAYNEIDRFNAMINDRCIITHNDFLLLSALVDSIHLAEELDKADLVDSARLPPNVVTINSRVRFEDEAEGTTREVTVVLPEDADLAKGKVSVLAPVGTALLGLAENQSIVWPFPDGSERRLRVLEVVYQPEADARLALEAQEIDVG